MCPSHPTGRLIRRSSQALLHSPVELWSHKGAIYGVLLTVIQSARCSALGRARSPYISNRRPPWLTSHDDLSANPNTLLSRHPRTALRCSTCSLYDKPWGRVRANGNLKRPYSSLSAPRKTVTGVEIDESPKNPLQNSRAVRVRIPEELSTAISSNSSPSTKTSLVSPLGTSSPKATKHVVPKFWSHRLYKSRSGSEIAVNYCKTLKSTEQVAQLFVNDTILGFDMEWKAQARALDSIQDNVSLIQLASSDRIALFQISRFVPGNTLKDLVSPTLKRILESPNITKVGVAAKADSSRLRKFLGIDARAIFELSHLHRLVKYYHSNPALINKRVVRLNEQVEEHFGLPLEKDDDVRCSNWASPLTYRQVQYAAADAYACYQLFHTMDAKRMALDPLPPLPAHAELDRPIRLVDEDSMNLDPADHQDTESVKSLVKS